MLIISACKKSDYIQLKPDSANETVVNKFLPMSGSVDVETQKVITKFRNHSSLIPGFVKANGFAIWDKGVLINAGSGSSSKETESQTGKSSTSDKAKV